MMASTVPFPDHGVPKITYKFDVVASDTINQSNKENVLLHQHLSSNINSHKKRKRRSNARVTPRKRRQTMHDTEDELFAEDVPLPLRILRPRKSVPYVLVSESDSNFETDHSSDVDDVSYSVASTSHTTSTYSSDTDPRRIDKGKGKELVDEEFDDDEHTEDQLDFFDDEVDAELEDGADEGDGIRRDADGAHVDQLSRSTQADDLTFPPPTDMPHHSPSQPLSSSSAHADQPSSSTHHNSTSPSPDPSESNICSYNGKTCSCTAAMHERDPSISSSSELHIDRDCEIMKVLGLSFHRRHRFLICECGSLLPLGDLLMHYKSIQISCGDSKQTRQDVTSPPS